MQLFDHPISPAELFSVLLTIVGLTFAYAVLAKLRDLPSFLVAIGNYSSIPGRFRNLIGICVVLAELFVAISHSSRIGLSTSIPVAIGLLGAFMLAAVTSIRQGNRPPCLCFGTDAAETIGAPTIIRIGALLAVELAILTFYLESQLDVPSSVSAIFRSVPTAISLIAIFVMCMSIKDVLLVAKKFFSLREALRRYSQLSKTQAMSKGPTT